MFPGGKYDTVSALNFQQFGRSQVSINRYILSGFPLASNNLSKTQDITKENLAHQLHTEGNAFSRYRRKVLGKNKGYFSLLQFELSQLLFANLGGGLGYLLRRFSLSSLFQACGKGVILGKGVVLRTPANISLGARVAIDDHTLLDGGTGKACKMVIRDNVIVSKGCVLQTKTGPLAIGNECDIGAHCVLTSAGGIHLAANVLIAGNCYIGGARYNIDSTEIPIMKQGIYSRGPVTIGEGTWIGASATIIDGVTIGKGCVVGAGALVTKDIPDFSIAMGSPAKVIKTRRLSENKDFGQNREVFAK